MLKAALYFRPGPGPLPEDGLPPRARARAVEAWGSARESVEQTCELMDKKRI